MNESIADRNKAENEVVFRKFNERMKMGIDELKKVAIAEGQYRYIPDTKKAIRFCCECADENCRERITISLNDYAKIHKSSNRFVIIPGHVVVAIERVVIKKPNYEVVEKFIVPPENVDRLHITDVDMSHK